MSIYEYCLECAFKRSDGCTRSGPTTRLIGRAKRDYRKRTRYKHFRYNIKCKKA